MHRLERRNHAELRDGDPISVAPVIPAFGKGGPPARPSAVRVRDVRVARAARSVGAWRAIGQARTPSAAGAVGAWRAVGRRLLAAAVAALLVLGSAAGAIAHEGGPRLIVAPDRVPPGGVVEVRGEDLGPDTEVKFLLVGRADGQVPVTSAVADGEGHVLVAVELPADLPVGSYRVRATVAGSGAMLDAAIVVEGAPVVAGGEPGGKDEDDPLLVAVPSGWQRSLSGPIVTARPLTETLPAGSASSDRLPLLGLLVLALGLGVLALVATARVRGRGRAPRG